MSRLLPRWIITGCMILAVAALFSLVWSGTRKSPTVSGQTGAVSASPYNVTSDFSKAQMLQNAGHCERAIPIYLRILVHDGAYTNAYVSLGGCYLTLGSPTAAVVEYNKAIQLDPTNFGLYMTRAATEYSFGNSGQAIADARVAMQLSTKQPASYVSISQLFSSFADFGDAIAAMNQAIALAPDNANLYEGRGKVFVTALQYGKAFADYQNAARIASYRAAHVRILGDLADVYVGQGDYDSAYNTMWQAIHLDPTNPHSYVHAGDIHQTGGRYSGAIGLYDQALALVSSGLDAEAAHEGKGNALAVLGRTQQAIAEYNAAMKLVAKGDVAGKSRLQAEIKAAQNPSS